MKKNSKEWALFGVFILIFVLLSILSPKNFLTLRNIQSMSFQLPEFGILALAMMVAILTGGINLSLVTTGTLGGIISSLLMVYLFNKGLPQGLAIATAILTAMAISLACGAVNGYIVSYVAAPAMMATLGTSTLYEGIGLYLSKGNSVSGFPGAFYWFGNGTIAGIPVPMVIFVIVIIATYILLERTPWGMNVYMTGSNRKAAEYSGINVNKVTLRVYLYSGFLGSMAMIIMMSRYNSARVDYGSSYLMQTVSAAVLGGTAISGGYGKVFGVVVAVAIMQVISSGLNIFGLDRSLTTVITGVILIGVLTLNFITSKTGGLKLKNIFKAKEM